MAILAPAEFEIAEALAGSVTSNPFLPDRVEREKKALGGRFVEHARFVHFRPEASVEEMFPNAPAMDARAEEVVGRMFRQIRSGTIPTERESVLYRELVLDHLFYKHVSISGSGMTVEQYRARAERRIVSAYGAYRKDFDRLLNVPGLKGDWRPDPEVAFALLFQGERAFVNTFTFIVGGSMAAARLRAAVWQSVFTHDMRRYARALQGQMGNVTTLITGPSGTGKELVARAIAASSYIPFDARKGRFVGDYRKCFRGLNLSALTGTLIESELFGHAMGAFTGATRDHFGYLDARHCRAWDTVFLDEIGDVAPQIQVKLLRVLQDREFQRIGEVETRRFPGKLVAATNRNLAEEMRAGRFREDFYYRLCGDQVVTPSLREQVEESPDEIVTFVRYIARQLLPGHEEEAGRLTEQAAEWIRRNLGSGYPWPGNIRELEQCVRSVMVRGTYAPVEEVRPEGAGSFLSAVEAGALDRDTLLKQYFSLVYSRTGSYRAAARRLGTDWRTVQRFVDHALAERFGKGSA